MNLVLFVVRPRFIVQATLANSVLSVNSVVRTRFIALATLAYFVFFAVKKHCNGICLICELRAPFSVLAGLGSARTEKKPQIALGYLGR